MYLLVTESWKKFCVTGCERPKPTKAWPAPVSTSAVGAKGCAPIPAKGLAYDASAAVP